MKDEPLVFLLPFAFLLLPFAFLSLLEINPR
jgi:hypothetical protein